jgi:hypothetical protein
MPPLRTKEDIIRLREPSIPRTDINAHTEEVLILWVYCRRWVFEWEGRYAEGYAVVVRGVVFACGVD